MYQLVSSYFLNVRGIEKNLAVAEKFAIKDRTRNARDLYFHQCLIEFIERGGQGLPTLNESTINRLLIEEYHRCEWMAKNAVILGERNRRGPLLNLASTIQGLYNETIISRARPSHIKFLDRINLVVNRFVIANLLDNEFSKPKRDALFRAKFLTMENL